MLNAAYNKIQIEKNRQQAAPPTTPYVIKFRSDTITYNVAEQIECSKNEFANGHF